MASIAEINGLTIPASGGAFLLDTYTNALAAYSVRRLATSTGALIRVRRVTGVGNTGNDDEADFSYDSNNELSLNSPISNADAGVNSTTLGSFLNVGTVNGVTYPDTDSLTNTAEGYCDTWYDQSSVGNHAEQSTPGNQPKIHDGTVNTDLIKRDGNYGLRYSGGQYLKSQNVPSMNQVPLSLFNVVSADTVLNHTFAATGFAGNQSSFNTWSHIVAGGSHYTEAKWSGVGSYQINSGVSPIGLASVNTISSLSGAEFFKNGTSIGTRIPLIRTDVGAVGKEIHLGSTVIPNRYLTGNISESIVFADTKSTNDINSIEGSVNAHFQLGNFGTPTSGFLSESYGTGAAAAYSVRQLSNTAALCIRVRRETGAGNAGNDDEANVLFDSNGELSLNSPISNADAGVNSTTLGSFLNVGTVNGVTYPDTDSLTNTAEGYCDTWFDQSGNSNDATQSTPGQQPQIHEGTVNTDLMTLNGKACIKWNATNQTFLQTPQTTGWSDGSTYTSMVFNGRAGLAGSQTYWDIELNVMRYSSSSNMLALYYTSPQLAVNTSSNATGQGLHTFYNVASETNAAIYIDGSLEGSSTRGANVPNNNVRAYIGSRVGAVQWNSCRYQEIIHWGSDVASNRTDIENNMNSHFQIY